MKLNEVSVGETVMVEELIATDKLRERLLALGLTKGALVEVIRRAAYGDPTVYGIRGAMIALRLEEASLIVVQDSVKRV